MKIEKLQIYTANIKEQFRFYRDVLGFTAQNYKEDSFELISGYSVLEFKLRKDATPYHIAFHIPDKQEEEALKWLKERLPVLKSNNQEIIDFSNWDAKSVYFYDEDKNIIEFIARRNFNKPASAIFSEKSPVGISEVGLATTNVQEKFYFLKENCELEKFDGDFEKFCAVGDPEGLLITINKDLKDWFPIDDTAFASEFIINFKQNEHSFELSFHNDELKLV